MCGHREAATSPTDHEKQGTADEAAVPLSLSSTTSRGAYHQCGSGRRVKLYVLEHQAWADRGTGYCASVYDQDRGEALLVVRKEECCESLGEVADAAATPDSSGPEYMVVVSESLETDDYLLHAPVIKEDVYQRQHDTLMVWTDLEGQDMALSFQELEGCHEIWGFVTEVQQHFAISQGLDFEKQEPLPPFDLPAPTPSALPSIRDKLHESSLHSSAMRENIVEWLLREEYVRKLVPLFEQAEALQDMSSLHALYGIMQTLFTINDNLITEYVLQDHDVYFAVAGMLEYRPDAPKEAHRAYLRDESRFHQIIEFDDPSIVSKIKETFRLIYLKDVMLVSFMDEAMLAMLNSLLFFYQNDIVHYCLHSERVWEQIRRVFYQDNRTWDVILFLQQLCHMSRQLQLTSRVSLIRSLVEAGILDMVSYALTQPDTCHAATDILMIMIEFDASCVRTHILNTCPSDMDARSPLFHTLVRVFHETHDTGLCGQMNEAWRLLMDANIDGMGMLAHQDDLDAYLAWMFQGPIQDLFAPLYQVPRLSTLAWDEPLSLSSHDQMLYLHLCDLWCCVMTQHPHRSRHYVLASDACSHIGSLLHVRDKHMRLAALRVLRAYAASQDLDLYQHLIDTQVLGHVLALLQREAPRDNLVSSACQSVLEQLRKDQAHPVLQHLIQTYASMLYQLRMNVTSHACITALIVQCERQRHAPPTTASTTTPPPTASSDGDHHDDAYFADEEEAPAPHVSGTEPFPALVRRRKLGDDGVDDDDVLERVAKRKSISHEPLARMERPAEASPSPRAVMADEPAGERT